MTLSRTTSILLFAAGIASASTVAVEAESRVLTIDPEASQVTFTLGSTLHDVEGRLVVKGGELHFDSQGGRASGEIVVDARRADTGNAKRDKKMHAKVLESESHPTMTFEVESLVGAVPESGSAEIELHGRLTLHGGRHAMVLAAQIEIEDGKLVATSAMSIPFVEWGMKDPSWLVLRVDKVVEVNLVIHGRIARADDS